eukprot:6171027-Pleurochrysis_carterae.AAC.2
MWRRSVGACVRSAGARGRSGVRESKASSSAIGSGASTARSWRGTRKGVPLSQSYFAPIVTAAANAATERREDRFTSGLAQDRASPGVKDRSTAGVADKSGECCPRAASSSVCGVVCWSRQSVPAGALARADRDALLACAWRMDMSRARTSASIAGLDKVKVKQSSAAFGGGGAAARLAAEGLTRV